MTTLIAVYSADGRADKRHVSGRCDARCYEAAGDACVCVCGGANHKAGRQRAEANVRELAATWIEKWTAEHGAGRVEIIEQMSLPFLED